MENRTNEKTSSLRWKILRQALRRHPSPNADEHSQVGIRRISRRTTHGFNLIPCNVLDEHETSDCAASGDVRISYTLPVQGAPKLVLTQRLDNQAHLSDFEICNRHNIDNTGLLFVSCHCQSKKKLEGSWPSEDVLAYHCLSHANLFRSKKVIELGSGYGLAGFVIAASTEASEVVISDGNPQICNGFPCQSDIQRNIEFNPGAFGDTMVKPLTLHWNREKNLDIANSFDIIVASDCTFFKDFHRDLARTVKLLLSKSGSSEAIFLCPKRGNSLDMFLDIINENGLHFTVTENYNTEVWKRHEGIMNEERESWPSYDKDHCYPLLIRITL